MLPRVDKSSETYHPYFHGHQCYLPKHKMTQYQIDCGRLRRFILDLIAVNKRDIRAQHMYRSYAGLCADKYYQYKHYPLSIHPFSVFRYALEVVLVFTMILCNMLIAICYSETNPDEKSYYATVITVFDIIYLVNVICNFFTGFVKGKTSQYVVLDLKMIILKYLTTWFIIDVASLAGLIYNNRHSQPYIAVILISLKILRLLPLYHYICNLLTVIRAGIIFRTAAELTFYLIVYLEWNIFFQFALEYYLANSFTPGDYRKCSWIYIGKLWNQTTSVRFVYALDRSVGMLRQNSNLNLIAQDGCFERFFIVAWIIGKLIVSHCGLKYMIALFGSESAQAKYFMMEQQVQIYMNQRKFPPRMKKKILKFYAIRFQSNFFVESRMITCVSGQLREDIIMHTGRQLVSHVAFLKQLPRSLLLQIGLKLKIVIFIAGDIIFKINTIGDCLYFIDKGTVAIYSESGKEVCHLEDGDFFGEIALVMKNRFRTASAVAVTNCELFRLDRADFESSIACYPTVYEDIRKVAASRFERTNILDEHHKTDMQMLNDNRKDKIFD